MSNLILHAGAQTATREQIEAVPTPDPTTTHFPIPHATLLGTVQRHMEASGYAIESEEYGLWGDEGERFFGVWTLRNGVAHADYQLALGLRNAHDKSVSAGMALGSRVFVCDNLALSAEIVVMRKHTRYVLRDLDRLVLQATGKLSEARDTQDRRISAYKETGLIDSEVHDVLVRAVDGKIMANSYIPHVLNEWRNPRHPEFEDRNAWSLFNGFTEVFKRTNPLDLTSRTMRLHGLMDEVAVAGGFDPQQLLLPGVN